MAQIDWNGFLPQESGKALTWGGVCLTALVGAGWVLFSFGYTRGKDIGQDELSAYKAASEAKLPEITSGLLAVNKELRESLKVFDRNKMLEAENASYQKQLAEAAKARADLDVAAKTAVDNERRLRDEISKLNGDNRSFQLTENRSEQLGEGHLVGLSGAASLSQLRVIQDNKEYVISAGSFIPVDLSDKRCVLTLTSMVWNPASGDFDWSCKTKWDSGFGSGPVVRKGERHKP